MLGELYLQCEMPEPPKESFFKGLFGGGTKSIDREELCKFSLTSLSFEFNLNHHVAWILTVGETSGKPNRSVAKLIAGPNASIQELGTRATSATSEVSRAHMLMVERGDKLNRLEDNAEKMANEAQQFSGTAHQLMAKYRDKKWYQL